MATPSDKVSKEENKSSPNIDTASRGRVDSTLERTASQRRLDSFAKLLAVNSECVAVSFINGKIWITANELHKKSQATNATISSINKIADYFCNIAAAGKVGDVKNRKAIFKNICSKSRIQKKMKTHFNVLNLSDTELGNIAELVFEARGQINLEDIIKKSAGKADEAAFVYTEFVKIYNKFIKLEEALTKPGTLDNDVFDAFKASKYQIMQMEESDKASSTKKQAKKEEEADEEEMIEVKDKTTSKKNQEGKIENKGVHAEVQILANLVGLVSDPNTKEIKPQQIYIGISKLCCLHCRCMIEVANKVFKEQGKGIQVIIRGKHDIDFNWNPPGLFKKGYFSYNEEGKELAESTDLRFLIGYQAHVLIKKLSKTSPQKHISLEDSGSHSESEERIEDKLKDEMTRLNRFLDYLKSFEGDKQELLKMCRWLWKFLTTIL